MNFKNIESLDKETNKEEKFLSELEEKMQDIKDTYIYVKKQAKYYWVEEKTFFSAWDVQNNLLLSQKEIKKVREFWLIPTYKDLVYREGWREWCFNTLNEETILKPSENPVLHPHIETLISNVCGHKKENIEYLHQAILYKHFNINDHTIPAIVFYGHGWSGKGTIISLLSTIFGEENTLANLGQKDLTGNFDTYRGQKLIVEFAEIATHNTHTDISVLNKLKNIIGAEKVTINEKWVKQYQIENPAWFFISSNSNKPLQLDDKDKGNRRFSIIKSTSSLSNGKEINQTIRDLQIVQDYLAWLYKEYNDTLFLNSLDALENQDKRDLEDMAQSEANQFWEWLEDNFPDYTGKKRKKDIDSMVEMFCNENSYDTKDFKRFFWKNSKYWYKKIRDWNETYYGVIIPEKDTVAVEDVKDIFN